MPPSTTSRPPTPINHRDGDSATTEQSEQKPSALGGAGDLDTSHPPASPVLRCPWSPCDWYMAGYLPPTQSDRELAAQIASMLLMMHVGVCHPKSHTSSDTQDTAMLRLSSASTHTVVRNNRVGQQEGAVDESLVVKIRRRPPDVRAATQDLSLLSRCSQTQDSRPELRVIRVWGGTCYSTHVILSYELPYYRHQLYFESQPCSFSGATFELSWLK
jgi:hypothetical protein